MQTIQLDSWLSRLASRLPAGLEPSFQACQRVAKHFRGDVMAVLEQPLGRAPEGLDFSVRLEQAQQCLEPGLLPPRVAELFALRAAGVFPAESLPAIWLEYDLRQGEGRAPISCFRLGPEVATSWVRRELLPRVGAGLGKPALAFLGEAIEALPAQTRLLYLFDLAARGRPLVRCEIAGEPGLLGPWLAKVGAVAQAGLLARLASWADEGDRPHVSVDFDGEWAPRVGLENSFRGQPRELGRWQTWLEALASAGLILPEQIGPLLAWPSVETPGEAAAWPLGAEGRPLPGWSVACLSHLKLALEPGQEVEVKAYRLFQQWPREVRDWPQR